MKAVVFHGEGDIRLDDVPEPKIQDDFDDTKASASCAKSVKASAISSAVTAS